MLELLSYLQSEGFKVYIVTGGDEDFVRTFSDEVYGIPPEEVIGSAFRLQFVENSSSISVVKLPQILVMDDGQEKAKEIVQNIGKRPILPTATRMVIFPCCSSLHRMAGMAWVS
jgi:hypothetical protein